MTNLILTPNEIPEKLDAAVALLDSLPVGSIIKALNERSNPAWPSVFIRTGTGSDPWLLLDPGGRNDESTYSSGPIVRYFGTASIKVLDRGPETEGSEPA
ncbi:hypothetical protein IV500_05115 [Paeniglutamicibacter antarcticus]|uniref:Uncharacterized protein n=1 Tax=Arthrobacter terrae TaxID=2935737 RepID=A0A931CNV1_9MICC|nr:hypothetical protein [Arthrobacter terrae]MBG0738799.1 hypothetical protein [Arthrobacter terrae]